MSNLSKFGIDPDGDPKQQLAKICGVLGALLNNPDLLVGKNKSIIKHPSQKAAAAIQAAGGPGHPFKIRVTENALTVDYGQISIMRVFNDMDAKPFIGMERAGILINGDALRNDPDGSTHGALAVLDDGTYGVWLEFLWAFSGPFDKTAGLSGEFLTWNLNSFALGVEVVASATHTDGSTQSIMGDSSTHSYIFIGRVVMTDGVAEVFQYLRSDLVVPGFALPNSILSGDGDQVLGLGTDGGINYDGTP